MPYLITFVMPPRNSGRQGVQRRCINKNSAGVDKKAPIKFFPLGNVNAGFPADRTVNLGKQRGRNLHKGNAAHVNSSQKSCNVAGYAASQGKQAVAAIKPALGKFTLPTNRWWTGFYWPHQGKTISSQATPACRSVCCIRSPYKAATLSSLMMANRLATAPSFKDARRSAPSPQGRQVIG